MPELGLMTPGAPVRGPKSELHQKPADLGLHHFQKMVLIFLKVTALLSVYMHTVIVLTIIITIFEPHTNVHETSAN